MDDKISAAIPAGRMGAGGRCVAVGLLGGVSRRAAPGPQDPPAREAARAALWAIFERVRAGLQDARPGHVVRHVHVGLRPSWPQPAAPAVRFRRGGRGAGYRASRSCGSWPRSAPARPDRLFFAGDLGQRIFQQPFSWKALGVDVRGRSFTLRVNYRTSHQIRMQADRLLGPEVSDVDGNTEDRERHGFGLQRAAPRRPRARHGRRGSQPWPANGSLTRAKEGVLPHEIGVFVRSEAELDRARAAVTAAGLQCQVLDENVETTSGRVSIGTMHLAKGLEFRAVAVMACDDEVIPLQERIETVTDDADLEEVYNTERHLLYVACTRARDHLLVTGMHPASEFLDDLSSN